MKSMNQTPSSWLFSLEFHLTYVGYHSNGWRLSSGSAEGFISTDFNAPFLWHLGGWLSEVFWRILKGFLVLQLWVVLLHYHQIWRINWAMILPTGIWIDVCLSFMGIGWSQEIRRGFGSTYPSTIARGSQKQPRLGSMQPSSLVLQKRLEKPGHSHSRHSNPEDRLWYNSRDWDCRPLPWSMKLQDRISLSAVIEGLFSDGWHTIFSWV